MSGSVGRAEAAGFQPAASPDPTVIIGEDNTTCRSEGPLLHPCS